MAAKTWTNTANSGVDELLFHNAAVSLCLLVNRRHSTLRIIDFRAGPTVAKRSFVVAAAKREGFGNSFFELLTAPRTEPERLAATSAVRTLEARLKDEGAVSTFTLGAADDVIQTAVFLGAGFRRSGVLARHVMLKGERKDAIAWSKKLAGAGDQA